MFGFKPKKLAVPAGVNDELDAIEAVDSSLQDSDSSSLAEANTLPTGEAVEIKAEEKTSKEADSMLDFTASQPASQETPKEESSLADLFGGSSHEEEKSSLTAILLRTPDASLDEILSELNDIREMLRGRLDEG